MCMCIVFKRIKDEYDKCMKCGIDENVSWKEMPAILTENKLLFVDGEFYPSNDSLYFAGGDALKDCKERYIMWRRAAHVFDGSSSKSGSALPMIFRSPSGLEKCVLPTCVKQGDSDDAWLTSVISVLALRPDLIACLFETKDSSFECARM